MDRWIDRIYFTPYHKNYPPMTKILDWILYVAKKEYECI